ncbi:LPS-assembly protein LptD [Rhodobacteraceae bacterium]|nr:LPS-assembly protein LptD [Paracoccaceae bacterium]
MDLPPTLRTVRARSGRIAAALVLGTGIVAPAAYHCVHAQTLGYSTESSLQAPDPARARNMQVPATTLGESAAQMPASLVADKIILTGTDQLIAQGNVESYYEGNRVTANRIIYDRTADTITLEGPVRLTEPNQQGAIILADQAELSRDLQNGILRGARMVMARELQLAANEIRREDGDVTTMSEVVASSCRICATGETPLWEIRARKITHNATDRQLLFENAQFRAAGVPVLWIPKFRMPDPTVDRMTGFLRPSLRTTSSLGTGVKLPYFIAIDPSQDLLLEPYLSSNWTTTLGMRYRRAFNDGTLEIAGAFSRDNIMEHDNRGYLFVDGSYDLPNDFTLGLQIRAVSDDAYLLNYDISDDDRLWSGLTLERVRPDELIWSRVGNTHTLREDESNSTQPMLAGNLEWIKIYHPARLGGELSVDWNLMSLRRSSDRLSDSSDLGGAPDGRDMTRGSVTADWRRNWLLRGGVLASAQAQLSADVFHISQDPEFDQTIARALPQLGAEIRWPWTRATGRAAHVIEPIAQIIWAPNHLRNAPNEDSTLLEFDEGNLFSFSRYPGYDARERGLRANLGVNWTRYDATGWSLGLTAGRVIYAEDLEQFPEGSGMSGTHSDWLLATHISTDSGLTLSNRAQIDDDLGISRDELRLAFAGEKHQLAASYIWMDDAILSGTSDDISELQLASAWNWGNGWSSTFDARYDLVEDRAARAAMGLEWVNDCVSVDLSLSRRFTSSSSVDPETSFGLSVSLAGFGGSNDGTAAQRVCVR